MRMKRALTVGFVILASTILLTAQNYVPKMPLNPSGFGILSCYAGAAAGGVWDTNNLKQCAITVYTTQEVDSAISSVRAVLPLKGSASITGRVLPAGTCTPPATINVTGAA